CETECPSLASLPVRLTKRSPAAATRVRARTRTNPGRQGIAARVGAGVPGGKMPATLHAQLPSGHLLMPGRDGRDVMNETMPRGRRPDGLPARGRGVSG